MLKATLATLLMALLAGCAGDSDLNADGASLDFDGSDSGTHSDSADCDDEGTLAGSGNVEDGTIQVTVTDGSGSQQFSKSYDGGIDVEAERMDGASGEWTLTVTRAGDDVLGDAFRGQYSFSLAC